MKMKWRVFASDMFIVIAIIMLLFTMYYMYDSHNKTQIDQQNHEIRSELCKSYFSHLNDTQYIALSEPEFSISETGQYICKIKFGRNCSNSIRQHNNKTFTINICKEVAYVSMNTGMYKG